MNGKWQWCCDKLDKSGVIVSQSQSFYSITESQVSRLGTTGGIKKIDSSCISKEKEVKDSKQSSLEEADGIKSEHHCKVVWQAASRNVISRTRRGTQKKVQSILRR